MSRTISVHNRSGNSQLFEVHGWNDNKNITVPAHGIIKINAPDGSSGAIIAVHDGHEGEQAEITKKGFGGNDFFDISYIVGAGGNLTIMQAGDPKTLKGHPTFMQALNNQWHKTDQKTKDIIKDSIHLDKSGNVIRLDRPASNPTLENFVRSFANDYGYIGPGSWNGNNGNDSDNNQSSAAHGDKDIIVTYSNGDARPESAPVSSNRYIIKAGDTFYSIAKSHGLSTHDIEIANPGVDPTKLKVGQVINLRQLDIVPQDDFQALDVQSHDAQNQTANTPLTNIPDQTFTMRSLNVKEVAKADHDDGKTSGIILTNKSKQTTTYFFYDNYWNGNGTAGANFDHPLKFVTIPSNHSTFVNLPTTFKGRVQRGKLIPATWVEFQIEASNDHKAHGDVSVEQGNDGPATIKSTDGTNVEGGFTQSIHAADRKAYVKRADGKEVLASTMGNWMGGPNQAAIKAQEGIRGRVYVTGGTGVPDVASGNKRFAVDFY